MKKCEWERVISYEYFRLVKKFKDKMVTQGQRGNGCDSGRVVKRELWEPRDAFKRKWFL